MVQLQSTLLKIENGKITNYSNRDIFIIVCGLYAEKHNEECIDIIEDLNDDYDKMHIIASYIDSFLWRKSGTIDRVAFIDIINRYKVHVETVWRVFIENSTKPTHPLNAEFLHNILLKKSIVDRDYLWTIYINELVDDSERLYQLIDYFDKGNLLDGLADENIHLLLILFSWLLTASNRTLRDKASKAMIEILKVNFRMCKPLLEKFETVNDPYVLQRLYGIVFGACLKRCSNYKDEYNELSDYIFRTVFNQSSVYPDILLRDYARLILEHWLYEFPESKGLIDETKIRPPYQSDEIPIVKKEHYYADDRSKDGFNSIEMSMHPDRIESGGTYGDFGRYVFQAAVTEFGDVDMDNLYHYAMQFIRDELKYDNELFGRYDTSHRHLYYSRHQTRKVERIGKKYQWIAMYNILARVSDKRLLTRWRDEAVQYDGAWDPYVRDFDPTLNVNFLKPSGLPHFQMLENVNEFISNHCEDESAIKEWSRGICKFFELHNSKLMLHDETGKTWILLNQFEEIKNDHYKHDRHIVGPAYGSQEMWSMSHGYFVRCEEFERIKSELEDKNFMGRWFPEGQGVYQLYNREYVWSPGYRSLFQSDWLNYEVETGEVIITEHKGMVPNFEFDDEDEFITFEEQEWEQSEPVKTVVGQVMPSYSRILWEEQYDASQEEATAFYVPCADLINTLKLEQREYDGYFYSEDGTLVSFDGNLSKNCDGLLIRKDYLDKYLRENNLVLLWPCLGEKWYYLEDSHKQILGEWSGLFYLIGEEIIGTMNCKKLYPKE